MDYEKVNSYIETVVRDALKAERRPVHAKFQAVALDGQDVLVVIHTAYFKVNNRIAYRLKRNFQSNTGMRIHFRFTGGGDQAGGDSLYHLEPDEHLRTQSVVARVRLLEKQYQVLDCSGNDPRGDGREIHRLLKQHYGHAPSYYGGGGFRQFVEDYRAVTGRRLPSPGSIQQLPIVKF